MDVSVVLPLTRSNRGRVRSAASTIRPSILEGLFPCRSDKCGVVVAPDHYFRKGVDLLDHWLARRLRHDQRYAFADKVDAERLKILSFRGFPNQGLGSATTSVSCTTHVQ